MRLLIFFVMTTLCFTSCAQKGYVPHYIVTDSQEPIQESPSIAEEAPKLEE